MLHSGCLTVGQHVYASSTFAEYLLIVELTNSMFKIFGDIPSNIKGTVPSFVECKLLIDSV